MRCNEGMPGCVDHAGVIGFVLGLDVQDCESGSSLVHTVTGMANLKKKHTQKNNVQYIVIGSLVTTSTRKHILLGEMLAFLRGSKFYIINHDKFLVYKNVQYKLGV